MTKEMEMRVMIHDQMFLEILLLWSSGLSEGQRRRLDSGGSQ